MSALRPEVFLLKLAEPSSGRKGIQSSSIHGRLDALCWPIHDQSTPELDARRVGRQVFRAPTAAWVCGSDALH